MSGKIKFGSFDSIYPNGIVIVGDGEAIFGVRLLTLDTQSGELIYGKQTELTVCPNYAEDHYEVRWKVNGKNACFSWTKTRSNQVLAETSFDDGLNVIAELYVPWRVRMKREWINYSMQSSRIFTGELVSPFSPVKNNAIRIMSDRQSVSFGGYNLRQEEYEHIKTQRKIVNVSPKQIWSDMGLWWHYGLMFDKNFRLLIDCGNGQDFLSLGGEKEIDEAFCRAAAQAKRKQKKIEKSAFRGTGIYENLCQVLPSALYHNTLYHYPSHRRYIITDRSWTRNEEDWGIIFNWDTFISSWMSAWFDGKLAQENMLCAYEMQLPDGKIPLHSRAADGFGSEPPITAGRAQHIVQGLTMWNTYLHTRDKSWLAKCYPKAKRAHEWWFTPCGDGRKRRDPKNIGLLTFGYDAEEEMGTLGARVQPYAGQAQYAYFETYDDSPQWTDGEFFKSTEGQEGTASDFTDEAKYDAQAHTATMYTLERSSLYAIDCQCLEKAARELGFEDDAVQFRAEYDQICEKINRYMWDEETGCYYNLRFDGTQSRVQSPDCFLPLAAGVPDHEQTRRLLQILTDENKFWGEYPMPSVSKDHPAYPTQTYWRGAIWPPLVMWTYLALKNAGDEALKWEYACRVGRMLENEWVKYNRYPENYNSITGLCNGAPHYNWGVLMALPLIEELVEVRLDSIVFGSEYAPMGSGISGIPLDGNIYAVQITQQGTKVFCNGEQIACGVGKIIVPRK